DRSKQGSNALDHAEIVLQWLWERVQQLARDRDVERGRGKGLGARLPDFVSHPCLLLGGEILGRRCKEEAHVAFDFRAPQGRNANRELNELFQIISPYLAPV